MKKVFMKSFFGIPLAIFLYELINIAFSIAIFENQYFRLDSFDLKEIIILYIELAIMGYILFFSMYYDKFLRDIGKKESEIAKKSAIIYVSIFILMVAMFFGISLLNPDSYSVAISFPLILMVFGIIGMIQGFCDGNLIKKINKKIKENQGNKKD